MRIFGKKPSAPATASNAASKELHSTGLARLLDHLNRIDADDPSMRMRLVGKLLFEYVCKEITDAKGVRIEDLLAILASVGGHSCTVGAIYTIAINGGYIRGQELVVATCIDGHNYYFGDLPNKALLDDEHSLVRLTLSAIESLGGSMTDEHIFETLQHVISTGGSPEFGIPRLPKQNQPTQHPFQIIEHWTPPLTAILKNYEISAPNWATTLGYSIQNAIIASKGSIDPSLAGVIVLECAVPSARIDPHRFL